jgi:S-adenosylmethionine uptake transporter
MALALIMALMRMLAHNGLSVYLLMFWQSVFSLLFVVAWCAYKGNFPRTKKLKLFILRTFSGYGSGSLLTLGLAAIPLNTSTAITFTGPLFTTLFAVLLLKERISIHRVVGLLIGFIGVMVVLRPGTEHFNYYCFYLIATAMLWGVTDVIIKILSRTESLVSILFYTTLVMMFVVTPMAVLNWREVTQHEILLLIALALCNLANFGAASQAYRYSDLSVLMPFEFSRLAFSSLLAYFIFAEILDKWVGLGAFIIMFGAVYVVYKEKRKMRIYESEL